MQTNLHNFHVSNNATVSCPWWVTDKLTSPFRSCIVKGVLRKQSQRGQIIEMTTLLNKIANEN